MIGNVVLVFVACTMMDFAYAIYIKRVTEHRARSAAMWAIVLFLLGAVGVISYTENHWLLVPAACGCFIGTYAATNRPLAKIIQAVEKHSRRK